MLDFREYIENAEEFAFQAREQKNDRRRNPLVVVATILAWCAIEEFVNSMLDDFSVLTTQLDLHELALLQEKKIYFHAQGQKIGEFSLDGTRYRKIDEKIYFLVSKFGQGVQASGLEKGNQLWQSFEEFKSARNSVVHPRLSEEGITIDQVEEFIQTAKDVIQILAKQVWNKTIRF